MRYASHGQVMLRAPGYFWSAGTAIVGNIRTRKRLKYGAQGNMLNAGARLDGLTKTIGTRILVSADIVGKRDGTVSVPPAPSWSKGRHGATEVFEPINPQTWDAA
jgi:hypothetical protein